MSALALVALVGLTVFLPFFMDDADDTDDTEEVDSTATPADPADPDDPLAPAVDRDEIAGSGDADTLTAQSGETVAGLGGADVMTTAPGSEGATIDGGDGDDTLELFGSNSTARGEAGDDVIRTQTFLDRGTSFDTLTGGFGADRFELSFLGGAPTGDPVDAGIVTTITDFLPGTYILFVDTQLDPLNDGTAPTLASITLSEEPDGSFTDLVFTTGTDEGSAPLTGTIRLLGTTGMTQDDLAFSEGSEISLIS